MGNVLELAEVVLPVPSDLEVLANQSLMLLFLGWQSLRLWRALHIFQLEGYKRARFLKWCLERRALFLRPASSKKPLVLTGRAARLFFAAIVLTAVATIAGTYLVEWLFPYWTSPSKGRIGWAVVGVAVFVALPFVLGVADVLLGPLQGAINARFMQRARAKLNDVAPLVVGVTGSFGKTSTKFAIGTLLGGDENVLATPGSFNTPLGICRTINEQLDPRHRFFVVEMGAYKRGEIAELCDFVRPSIGVLTAIGPAHLERFGSIEAIESAKYEIVRSLPSDGVAVMNVDDLRVRALADATTHVKVVRYGLDPAGAPDVTASDAVVGASGTELTIRAEGQRARVGTKLLGSHAVGHILAGVAVARELLPDRRLDELTVAVAELTPVEHRLQLLEGTGGVTVIDDAFNSNPDGARVALEVLDAMPAHQKIVVTPGMIELGDLQSDANRTFGKHAAGVADVLIAVARVNRAALLEGAAEGSARVIAVDSLAEATAELAQLLAPGDVVLFENDLPDQYEGAGA